MGYLTIVHLLLHDPVEVLHWRVVVAIAFARHALKCAHDFFRNVREIHSEEV